jgi:hypothetical protein
VNYYKPITCSTFNSLNIYYQNVRGIRTKTLDLYNSILSNNFDIILLSETWLDDSINCAEIIDDRYMVYRRDRPREFMIKYNKSYGGGTLVAVKKSIISEHKPEWQTSIEDLWVRIKLRNFWLSICIAYLPSYLSCEHYSQFLENCEKILSLTSDAQSLIVGDFNLSDIDWSGNYNGLPHHYSEVKSASLSEFMAATDMVQLNSVFNHNNRMLDLVLVTSGLSCSVTEAVGLSRIDDHHPPLEIIIKAEKIRLMKENVTPRLLFRKTDYNACLTELSEIDWEQFGDLSCDDFVQYFYSVLWEIIEKYTPKARPKSHKYPTWFNPQLVKMLKEKKRFHAKYRKFSNPRDFDAFSLLRARCKAEVQHCFRQYIGLIEENLKYDIGSFWRYTKSKKVTNSYPDKLFYKGHSAEGGVNIANLFSVFFSTVYTKPNQSVHSPGSEPPTFALASIHITDRDIKTQIKSIDPKKGAGPDGIPPLFVQRCSDGLARPLSIIFNKSISTGTFPGLWKITNIVPIHKSGDKRCASNYRPISILSTFAKIFESIVYRHIYAHFKLLVSPRQHGFMRARSTTTNLLTYTHYLNTIFDQSGQVDAIYTDFAKAFDRVDHSILCVKAKHLGIHGPLLEWLISYLQNRPQIVIIGGHESAPFVAESGVPQGSNLGPLLFLIFINDLLDSFSCECLAFADDIKLFKRIQSVDDCIALQSDIKVLTDWCTNNNMSLNTKKCQVINFTKKRNVLVFQYNILNIPLEHVDIVRDLGVWFDSKLSFRTHYDTIIMRARRMLGFINRVAKPFKNSDSLIVLYNSLVRNILEYCSTIWSPCYDNHISRLESIQKRFLRGLSFKLGLGKVLKSYDERLLKFKVDSLLMRRQLSDLSTLHKIANSTFDSDILSHVSLRFTSKSNRRQHLFYIPLSKNNVSQNSPLIRMCKKYNSICKEFDLDIFHQNLKSFLKTIRSSEDISVLLNMNY